MGLPTRKSGFLHEAVSGNDADHGKLREMVQAPAGALPRPRARVRAWGRVPVGLSGSVGPGWIAGNAAARKGAPGKHAAVVLSMVTYFKENRGVFFD